LGCRHPDRQAVWVQARRQILHISTDGEIFASQPTGIGRAPARRQVQRSENTSKKLHGFPAMVGNALIVRAKRLSYRNSRTNLDSFAAITDPDLLSFHHDNHMLSGRLARELLEPSIAPRHHASGESGPRSACGAVCRSTGAKGGRLRGLGRLLL
jgi:hypothetical protein